MEWFVVIALFALVAAMFFVAKEISSHDRS